MGRVGVFKIQTQNCRQKPIVDNARVLIESKKMQVRIPSDLLCGGIQVPAGDYLVALSADSQQVRLTGRGLDLLLPALRRRNKAQGRHDTVSFHNAGGTAFSILVMSPKLGEWIVMLEKGKELKK